MRNKKQKSQKQQQSRGTLAQKASMAMYKIICESDTINPDNVDKNVRMQVLLHLKEEMLKAEMYEQVEVLKKAIMSV
jgi:hypothetical protein